MTLALCTRGDLLSLREVACLFSIHINTFESLAVGVEQLGHPMMVPPPPSFPNFTSFRFPCIARQFLLKHVVMVSRLANGRMSGLYPEWAA